MTPLLLALLISSGTATTDMASSQTNAATASSVAAKSTGIAAPMPPKVSAVPVSTGCGTAAVTVQAHEAIGIDFGGVLFGRPAMQLPAGGFGTIGFDGAPGSQHHWQVRHYLTLEVLAEGVFTVPACISAPERPTVVTVVDPPPDIEVGTPLTITRTRWAFWNWTLRRFGGAW